MIILTPCAGWALLLIIFSYLCLLPLYILAEATIGMIKYLYEGWI